TPGPGGITPRGSVTWESQAQLLITQATGAYGRVDFKTVQVGAPGYLSGLSPIYAGLANGDAVQAATRDPKVRGIVTATEGIDPNTGGYTPFVNLTATAATAKNAAILAKRGIRALQDYINQMEASTGVPVTDRINLAVIRSGLPPAVASKPKPTIPVLVFIATMAGLIMLLFSLENKDPRSAATLGRVPTLAANGAGPGQVDAGVAAAHAHRERGAHRPPALDAL